MASSHEDDILLEDYSKKVSFKSSIIFTFYGLVAASTPICKFVCFVTCGPAGDCQLVMLERLS